jgi:acetolactate synthase I/II/III large subunit
MNGAESLVRTLVAGGVNVCFANPGTSEMHFVAALDRVDGMRCVLGLFEGVVTGAADGWARMTDRPAGTLLHLGPGLANGLANLHNATKASTPVVNIVGDHATYHRKYDAPLTSDIETAAKPFSRWVHTSPDAKLVASAGAAAIQAALEPPGGVATLILPADTAWNESNGPAPIHPLPKRAKVSAEAVKEAARILRSGEPTMILLGGHTLRDRGLELAGKICAKTGAKMLAQGSNARMERGAGRVAVNRVPYVVEQALGVLAGLKHIILVGSKVPVAFFAYPDKPSLLVPTDCAPHTLAAAPEDGVHALEWLADELGAKDIPAPFNKLAPSALGTGKITPEALAMSLGALMPENAIVIDEGVTTGRGFFPSTQTARPHSWLANMGGSIGLGLPMATGAAIACPDRKVVSLQADGSGMYTVQALWTMARENLDVTMAIFANRTYAILQGEFVNVGAQKAGKKAMDMLEIGRPDLDWVSMARGMGVPATRVTDMDGFNRHFAEGLATSGPYLVEAVM